MRVCDSCGLYKSCNGIVSARVFGNKDNIKIILIGEAPGKEENIHRIAFIGKSGKLLDEILGRMFGSDIGIYITNAVKCMPTDKDGNIRRPSKDEIKYCKSILEDEISRFDDVVIISLGSVPLESLKGIKNVSNYIGNVLDVKIKGKNYKCVVNYHPAYILRNMQKLEEFVSVFKTVKDYVSGNNIRMSYRIIDDPDEYENLVDWFIKDNKYFYADIESKSINLERHTDGLVFGISLAVPRDDTVYYVPLVHNKTSKTIQFRSITSRLFSSLPVVGHNIKFDIVQLMYDGVINSFRIKDDTYILAHIKYNRSIPQLSLKYLARVMFSVFEDWDVKLKDYMKRHKLSSYADVPIEIISEYACLDVYYTKRLYEEILNDVSNTFLASMYRVILTEVIRWEVRGIPIDWEFLDYADNKVSKLISDIQSNIDNHPLVVKYRIDKRLDSVNTNSTKVLTDILVNYAGIKPVKTTDSGNASFDRDTLLSLLNSDISQDQRDMIRLVLDMRDAMKYKSSYIDSIRKARDGGVARFQFHVCGTVTGRISSPIHSLPSRGEKSEMKRLIYSPNRVIVSLDYSQLEPRVLASVCNDEFMIESFQSGKDLYKSIGSRMLGVPEDSIDKDTRRKIKGVLLGVIYGMSKHGLADTLNISEDDADGLIDSFFRSFPNVRQYIDEKHAEVRKHGGVYTPHGRFIPIPEIRSSDKSVYNDALRKAQNYPIQSTASEIALYMFSMFGSVVRKYNSEVVLSVHDSLVIEADPMHVVDVLEAIKVYLEELPMKKFPFIRVPMKTDVSIGISWGGSMSLIERDGNVMVLSGYVNDFRMLKSRLPMKSIDMLERQEIKNDSILYPYDNHDHVVVKISV